MKFTPKTEDEIAKENLIADGIYPFEVTQSAEETSKSGNPMLHLELRIFVEEKMRVLDDYLLEKMAFKLRHFCSNTGLLDLYQQGNLTADDCLGKGGWVKIGMQPDKSGKYPPRNTVVDYVAKPEGSPASLKPQPTADQLANKNTGADEDVPF